MTSTRIAALGFRKTAAQLTQSFVNLMQSWSDAVEPGTGVVSVNNHGMHTER